ncbi:MSMEG_1061 family FMN-dependent PPOX-type flavoprotein [Roseovarius rhodophyticola]|uniref:MSMEG_1061 family FMN-dependent PPOX-type flavoprotein n=1 Tax=Roseovarius rhodophyticola TaxID=3080827 RepID=A0ABZ2TBS2_9RHOB|nr:MSMEG_1061 family FMN-dependent PPOX-type flavoprotein [Roseovarius sp. W115]MDV2930874.1 pyridoxamine 5'-phosphate oxidase family protein [Roseovarius sp. W115]
MYQPKDVLTSIDQIYADMRRPYDSQTGKFIDHVDDHIRVWIEHSTFLTMATVDKSGNMDVSPKGDPAGFVKVLDRKTLAIPDRPGNHRYDGFQNLFETGRIGLVFFVPHRTEVVRVNGSAVVVRDMEVREQCAIKGRIPDFAVIVTVEEAFYHCGKSVIRSRLWQSDAHPKPEGLPTYAEALIAHGNLDVDYDDMHAHLRNNEENRLYDE